LGRIQDYPEPLPAAENVIMPEVKRVVRPVEVNYLCDACSKGMLEHSSDMDPETGAIEHQCMICDHKQTFKWKRYPRIEHIGEDETF
jgi:hypothetical protein